MKTFTHIVVSLTVMLSAGCAAPQSGAKVQPSPKEKVVALLKSIENGDPEPVGYINPDKYIQHNLAVKDSLAGFGEVMQQLPKGRARS